jgi:hypothetical protein
MLYNYRGLYSVRERRLKRGRWSGENTNSFKCYNIVHLFFWILSFYSTLIIAEYIDDNSDSFIDIDDFDSDDDGADIEELNDNNRDPTIPLSNKKGYSSEYYW